MLFHNCSNFFEFLAKEHIAKIVWHYAEIHQYNCPILMEYEKWVILPIGRKTG